MQFLFMKRPWAWILTLLLSCPLTLWAEFVEVAPQVKIYYESSGQGEPLLFVPGWMMTAGVWKQQVAEFSKTHRVIVMDPRGQGNSSKALSGNTLQQQAKDLRRLMESPATRWSHGGGLVYGRSGRAGVCESVRKPAIEVVSPGGWLAVDGEKGRLAAWVDGRGNESSCSGLGKQSDGENQRVYRQHVHH